MQIALVLIVLLLTFPALLLMRGVMGRRIKKLMFRSSEKAAADKLPRHESKEVPAGSILNIEEFNSESVPEEANDARKSAARQAASSFHWSWIYEAAACVAYLLAGSLAGISSDTFNFSAGLALVYFVIITVRYVLHIRLYHQVRGQRPFSGFQHIIGTVILGPLRLIFGTRTQLVPFLIAVAFAVFIAVTSESIVAKIAIGIAIVLHVGLRVRLYQQSQHVDNKRLLMLRVFGMDKSAFLTFGYMLDYWRRNGSSFTVVDPSYFRYEHRALSGRNIAIVFWSVTIASFGLTGLTEQMQTDATYANDPEGAAIGALGALVFGVSMLIIIGYIIYMIVLFAKMPMSFADSKAQISERLEQLMRRPRNFELGFKDLHMYCFDNTWRLAVAAFVESADVVLMDLRGYSEKRKGCEYEVDFIFDSIKVKRIVFLVDKKSDLEEVRKLIIDRWEHLKVDSPNLGASAPVAKIYLSANQRAKDVKGLLNLLFEGAVADSSLEKDSL